MNALYTFYQIKNHFNIEFLRIFRLLLHITVMSQLWLTFNSKSKSAQLTILRNTIFKYETSSHHKTVEKIVEVANCESIKKDCNSLTIKLLPLQKTYSEQNII